MALKFDFTHLLYSETIPNGIKPDEIEKNRARAEDAHRKIINDRKNDILGFYELPDFDTKKIHAFVNDVREDFDCMVVLGIGGSALGNRALFTALKTEKNLDRKLYIADNVDPYMMKEILDQVELPRTLFNVITKSGTTAETMSTYLIVLNMLRDVFGPDYKKHVVVTTDAEKGFLRQLIVKEGYRDFVVPGNVGGRFSVLTDVGLVSSAFVGIDIDKLLEGAKAMRTRCENEDVMKNPAYLNALLHVLYMEKGMNISVMMPYSNPLYDMADWYRQLWAESLGKRYDVDGNEIFVGQTPVKALGTTDQHSQVQLYVEGPCDKVTTFLGLETFTWDYEIPAIYPERDEVNYLGGQSLSTLLNVERQATEIALTDAGRPNCTILFPTLDEHHLGEFIFLYEVQTVFAGKLLNIDPLDQPGVEAGKIATYAMMGKKGFDARRKEIERFMKSKIEKGKIL